ncbi:MAG: GldG family protein, partial [Pseudomonadales bacterium]|nr:GldG family protein [Pseudomonadales bacterium]
MKRKLYSTTGLILLVLAFLAFTVLNNLFFSTLRLDLTESNLYTLSNGSREIIDGIDETINFYFFFSDEASEDLSSLRTFAKRVEELLGEYVLYSDGKIKLHVVDPEPFSEAEDQAADFGLQGVPVNASGDELYFGLAGTNTLDDQATIPFFQPDKEELLEYEISKLLHNLTVTEKPVIGLMSSLKIQGDMNMQTFQSTPPWMVVSQIEQLFKVESVDVSAEKIDEKLDVLMVVHPKNISEATLFAIDQFVLKGGHLLVFVDP